MRTLFSPFFESELHRQANRDGRKTMTRRAIKLPDKSWILGKRPTSWGPQDDMWPFYTMVDPVGTYPTGIRSPYGCPGTVWYMREPLRQSMNGMTIYADDNVGVSGRTGKGLALWPWKSLSLSSGFMPRWAARTFLLVTDVRVERLQDLTADDAMAEGGYGRGEFWTVWNSNNTKRGFPWESNPWVWVYSYRLATAEEARNAE